MKRLSFFLASASAFLLLNACGGTANHTLGTPGLTASHLSVTVQSACAAGAPFNFTVTALDASNNIVTSFAGKVDFASTDAQALLPPSDATLINGAGAFQATLNGAGPQTLTVTDAASGSITGTSRSIQVSTAVPARFWVAAPITAASGTTFRFPVTAMDGAGNLVDSYSGVVHFTSTDGQAVLPPDSGMANGVGTFFAAMTNPGPQEITATDVSTALSGTSGSIDVLTAGTFVITSGQPPNGLVGEPYGGFEQVCVTGMIDGFQLEAFATGRERSDRGGAVVVWSSSALPPGLQISSIMLGGPPPCPHGTVTVVDGRPTTIGTYTFTLTASDSVQSASASYAITIENATK